MSFNVSEHVLIQPSEEWQMVDKEKAKELEREARIQVCSKAMHAQCSTSVSQQARIAARSKEQHDGGSPFKVQLRSRDAPNPAASPATKTDQPKAEFQSYKLRKTPSQVRRRLINIRT